MSLASASYRDAEPAATKGSLEDRILHAEQRLLAREDALRQHWGDLTQRVQQALHPVRLMTPLMSGLFAGGALWWWARSRSLRPAGASAARAAAAEAQGAGGVGGRVHHVGLPWVRMLGLAWPLMPAGWRSRVSPATATTVIAVTLPWFERLLARRQAPPLATMPQVDLGRWAGTWYEVARLPTRQEPRCSGQPRMLYALRLDGRIDVLSRCPDAGTGGRHGLQARGLAQVVPGSGGARLKLSLAPGLLRWLRPAWQDHWILHVDDDYHEAVVGSPGRDTLKLLSRRPWLPPERLGALVQIGQERGYAVQRLKFTRPG